MSHLINDIVIDDLIERIDSGDIELDLPLTLIPKNSYSKSEMNYLKKSTEGLQIYLRESTEIEEHNNREWENALRRDRRD